MKIGILYHSETGNTKKIAQNIYNHFEPEADIFNISQVFPDSIVRYDYIFIGMPTHGDNLPEKFRNPKIWEILSGREIALFFTHTTQMTSYSPEKLLENAKRIFDEQNVIIKESWHCRGENKRVDIVEWLRIHQPDRYEQAFTAVGSPTEIDERNVIDWAKDILKSFSLEVKE